MNSFNPKIVHKMAGYFVNPSMYVKTDPWQYLNDWQQSDREYDPDEILTINFLMQRNYPGKYKIVKKASEYGRFKYYDFEFDTPAAETMFRLKYPS